MLELKEKVKVISDEKISEIYSYCSKVSKESIEEITDALLRLVLNSKRGELKDSLGQVIFHLQKNERINTLIGLQKLIEASLRVAPEEMFKVLESSDEDAKQLAQNIKKVLQI
ncbi:MAG: hypothetical protein ACTSVV_04390 [Promethearchaeota archaeon]